MRFHRTMVLVLASSCLLAHANEPTVSPPIRPDSETTAVADTAVFDTLREALRKHPEVQRAYLVRHPNSAQVFLIPIFDAAPVQAALEDAVDAYAKAAPDGQPLGIVLHSKRTWKRETAGLEPFYVRPRLP